MATITSIKSKARTSLSGAKQAAMQMAKADPRVAQSYLDSIVKLVECIDELSDVASAQQNEIDELKNQNRPGFIRP
jgi:hypothetical protein